MHRLPTVTLVAILAAACSATGSGPAPVSATALEGHLRFLASDALEGRMTGTRGYDLAAAYVESQFRVMGLEPAGTDGFRQPVRYAASLIAADRSRVRMFRGGKSVTLKWKQDWTAGCDPLDEAPAVRAPVVFAGYGVHAPEFGHDDYADLEVKGKLVAVMTGAPKSLESNPRAYFSSASVKRAAAAAHGAVGMIGLRDAYDIKTYPWEKTARKAGTIPSMSWVTGHGAAADHHPSLRALLSLSEDAAARLFEGAAASHAELLAANADGQPLPRFALDVELDVRRHCALTHVTADNVIARLPGSDPALADEAVIYTAHLDHIGISTPVDGDAIYNGAYDNAMGVAAMLETARAMLLSRERPRRSVLFLATSGEERGLLGADYFATHPTVPIDRLVANVNLDMPLFTWPLVDVVAFGAEHTSLGDIVARAAEAEGWALSPDPLPDEVIFIRSDQYPLVKQGIPAVFLVSGFGSADPETAGGKGFMGFLQTHYHQPTDDLSRPVHWPSATRFVRVNTRIGLAIADAVERPAWHPGNFFGERFARD